MMLRSGSIKIEGQAQRNRMRLHVVCGVLIGGAVLDHDEIGQLKTLVGTR